MHESNTKQSSHLPAVPISDQTELIAWYHEISSVSRKGTFSTGPEIAVEKPAPFKCYPDSFAKTVLPEPRGFESSRAIDEALVAIPRMRTGAFTLEDLSRLLHFSAGVTGQKGQTALRAAPSSGGTFAIELYVIVRDVKGIDPGIYHYSAFDNSIVQLEQGGISPENIGLAGLHAYPENAPVIVVASVVFGRAQARFSSRSYRYMMADVGHVLQNVCVVAGELGLVCSIADIFDQSVAQTRIHLDPSHEAVVAMAVLHDKNESLKQDMNAFALVQPQPDRNNPVLCMLRAASMIVADAASGTAQADGTNGALAYTSRGVICRDLPAGEIVRIQSKQQAPMDVWQVLQTRRSDRVFSSEPLTAQEFSSILQAMIANGPLVSQSVQIWVCVHRVQNMPAGIYAYDRQAANLRLIHQQDLSQACGVALYGQKMAQRGAVLLIAAIDGKAASAQGARGYQRAWIEAGMMCERVYLDAWGRGLGACAIGAYYDDETTELLNFSDAMWPGEMMIVGHT